MTSIPARSWLDPRIEARPSPISGRGLFAAAPIRAGEVVIVWGGPSYTDAAGVQQAIQAGIPVMQWASDIYSVAGNGDESGDETAFCVNHSCDPNVWMSDAFTLIARRDIAAGEEIVADYGLWSADDAYVSAWECHCRSALCRTCVTGRDWRRADLQERYAGHFSPLLNERIASLAQRHEAPPEHGA